MAYDCGKPRGPIWKVAWAGVKDKWPGAYNMIQEFRDSTMMKWGTMIAAIDLNGQDLDAVVADWLANNQARWKELAKIDWYGSLYPLRTARSVGSGWLFRKPGQYNSTCMSDRGRCWLIRFGWFGVAGIAVLMVYLGQVE